MTHVVLNPQVQDEIVRLAKVEQVDVQLLEEFAYFVVQSTKRKTKREENLLKIDHLKKSICERFNVKNTDGLKKFGAFKMATDGMEKPDFRLKSTWEMLYENLLAFSLKRTVSKDTDALMVLMYFNILSLGKYLN